MLSGTECMTMIFIRVCLADKWTPKSVSCNKFVARQKEVNVDVLVNCSSFFAGCLCVQEWTLAALSLANTRTIMHTSGHRNWSDVECTIIPLLWSRLDLFSSFGASNWRIFVDAVEVHSCLGSKCPAVDVMSVDVVYRFHIHILMVMTSKTYETAASAPLPMPCCARCRRLVQCSSTQSMATLSL